MRYLLSSDLIACFDLSRPKVKVLGVLLLVEVHEVPGSEAMVTGSVSRLDAHLASFEGVLQY
jgi:hypothetical protein